MKKEQSSDLGNRTVYCGNLAWSVAWQDLKDHLKAIGPVEFCEILQYRDGRKTGSGIARFEKAEDAERAISELKDSELKGRPLLIRADRENGIGPGSGKGKGKGGKPLPEEMAEKQVYVGNLSWKTNWRSLKEHCEKIGTVDYCDILVDKDGRSAGAGLVRFQELEDSKRAIEELVDSELDGRKIFVREDREGRPITGMSVKGKGKGKGKGNGEWSLFVGNLEKNTDWKVLKEAFKEYWPTHVAISETKGEKTFGLVKFARASHAEEAIEGMNHSWVGNNQLSVRWDEKPNGV